MLGTLLLATQVTGAPAPVSPAAASTSRIVINEVMPRAGSGQYEWVELYNPFYVLYLPLIMRNYGGQSAQSIGSTFLATAGANIANWQVSDEDGNVYTVPADFPPVPPKAFVLIYFDGQGPGANDYDFSDGVAVLHTPPGLVNIFDDAADQVALYRGGARSSDTIVDFVAYGGSPGEQAANAVAAGIWQGEWWVGLYVGSGAEEAGASLPVNRSLGVYPGRLAASPGDWAVYQGDDLTPGAANPVPRPYWTTVASGAGLGSDAFALGWSLTPGATYHFQMDDQANFGSPLADAILPTPAYVPTSPVPAGIYYWRVRAMDSGGRSGAWSTPMTVTVHAVAGGHAAGDVGIAQAVIQQTIVPNIQWLRQRKDTRLLCLDGCQEGNPATNVDEEAWDARHPDAIYVHGRNNCVRASIAIIVTRYGASLSQDRLAYRLLENNGTPIEDQGQLGNPHADLGHDRTTLLGGGDGSSGRTLLAWALGVTNADITYGWVKPSFATIQGWINNGRPILRGEFFPGGGGHATVIAGYRTLADGTPQVRLLDPWSAATWQDYNPMVVSVYYVAPANAPGVRSDEPGIWTDSDNDGIMDWDEQVRFFTNNALTDSDGDTVNDKQDIREYVFDNAGNYSLRNADWDGDGARKELDADNDNDGYPDGCEDANGNGKKGAGETDNFNAASSGSCPPRRLDILYPLQGSAVNAGDPAAPDKVMIRLSVGVPTSWLPNLHASDFSVRIGPQNAPAPLSGLPVGNEYWLLVQAPGQTVANFYNLTVTLGTLSDTETRAVYYLPQARTDQMIVLDSSGSMADYGKMTAAKNAARLFVDHTAVDDKIGVAVFTTTAQTIYTLRTVTAGGAEWTGAKNAINALSSSPPASWLTALGKGVQQGQNQLTAGGAADHDWSIVLLSDGLQNVTPYWDDATVKGVVVPTKTVVHTIALGPDADQALMSRIASETGGDYYYVPLEGAAGAAAQGVGVTGYPNYLANRLADVYKSAAETDAHQQRLWEAIGEVGREQSQVCHSVPVPPALPEGIFAVNWHTSAGSLSMSLERPDGTAVSCSDPNVRCLSDPTHEQYRITTPPSGFWKLCLNSYKEPVEYLAMLSGHSPVQMWLTIGLSPQERSVGTPIPLVVIIADYKPIAGATVTATVKGPNKELDQTLVLYDDGHHQDGKAGDGIYGNLYTRTNLSGSYVVRAYAQGKDNSGENFWRYRTGAFYVLPRVAYIHSSDLVTAHGFKNLLDNAGLATTLIPMDTITRSTSFSRYGLILIGPETGSGNIWGDSEKVSAISQSGKPILGIGDGGYAFFGKLGLAIGYPWSAHGWERTTVAISPTLEFWTTPYPIDTGRVVTIYTSLQDTVDNYTPPATVLRIGRVEGQSVYFNLVQQPADLRRYLEWGFNGGPAAMTTTGTQVFVNAAWYMVQK